MTREFEDFVLYCCITLDIPLCRMKYSMISGHRSRRMIPYQPEERLKDCDLAQQCYAPTNAETNVYRTNAPLA